MADGDYERHAARDAELKRLARIMREARMPKAESRPSVSSRVLGIVKTDFKSAAICDILPHIAEMVLFRQGKDNKTK